MPVLNPAELWQRSGPLRRSTELFKLKDRRGADLVLAMTHEEVVTTHVAPGRALLPRPAADPLPLPDQGARRAAPARRRAAHARVHHEGLLHVRPRRARASTRATSKHREAYDRIFDRVGLEWYRVESDVGMMGGIGAHEYMAPCPAGENDVALAPGYAANVEVASAHAAAGRAADGARRARARSTRPGLTTVARGRASARRVPPGALLKAFPVIVGEDRGLRARARARRPPRQRDQARATRSARRSGPRARGRVRRADRAGRLHRPGRHRRADPARRRASSARRLRHRRQPRPTRTCAASSPAATSRSSAVDVRTRRGRRHRRRARDPDRAGDRGRQHLQARHALLGAARRDLPRRGGHGAADLDGLLRHRPGAHRRRRGRAVRRRARASRGRARSRRSTSTSSGSARRAARSASSPSGSTTSCARPGSTCSTTTATPARARSSPTPSCSACRCG